MSEKVLLVDMDGTLARFHDETDYLERMFEEGFFERLQPFTNVAESIRLFIRNHPEIRVCTCSAAIDSPYCVAEKDRWLDRYLPEIKIENRIYTEMGRSKAEYLEGGASRDIYLLDDYNKGLHMFQYDGGSAIKCHNNINQKGLGAHGGERGYMWTGPMIHTDDPPALIAEELAYLMGLSHSLETASQSCHAQFIPEIAHTDLPSRHFDKTHLKHLAFIENNSIGKCYMASNREKNSRATAIFQNPYNALRYLNGDPRALEYTMRLQTGERVYASGYQLQAICQNIYGNTGFQRYLYADHAQLAEEVKSALRHRNDPIIGFVCEANCSGTEFSHMPFYCPRDMLQHIQHCEETGLQYRAEWFINPPQAATEPHQQRNSSLSNKIENAQQRANEALTGSSQGKGPDIH